MFADLDRLIMPGLSHWQHPRFFGYFPANSELSSVLGDYLSTGLGVLGLSWQASPALTELEEVVADWMRQMVGLSDAWSGVIQDTASTATLVALICARERTSGYGLAGGGLQASAAPLVVYASRQAHSSVDKAALLAGFGRDNIRLIDADAAYAMRPDALEAAISADRAAGRTPCAVVATTGTTTTTALDPVEAIGAAARRHGLWLHVDSAMAGSAMILPECRWMWQGVEGADSVVLNPHKWLGAAFDCSLYYVRDPEHLIRVMSTNPSYLQTSVDGEVKNLRDWGIPLGRRFRALKLWCLLARRGRRGLAGAAASRSRQRKLARRRGRTRCGLEASCADAAADAVPAPRADRPDRRGARPPYAGLGRGGQPLRRGLSDAGDAGRSLDGPRFDRRAADRARPCRRPVAGDARGGRTLSVTRGLGIGGD